jgi:hypothetical protein
MTDGNRRRRQVNLQIASFVIESHNHPDVFVPGHALRLAIGEAQSDWKDQRERFALIPYRP